ncbi:glutathione S-transferase T3-like [Salvia splendens]|uniref:glutathione S-transferase T3-like n=1 Tax=Salvia splendens TaxID=180675 RepID=UPI001C278892|nr:glutathione S-transferase T3-like [Salvia splendens]
MEWFNNDELQMNEFVNGNNWYVPPTPNPDATPIPGVATNMEITSPVDMEPAKGRGKGKVADDEGPKKYSPQETLWLAKNFVDVSEDPIIGNHQSGKVFWQRIAEKYNVGRPRGSFERSYVKLRKHWGRVQKEMNKWNGKWTNVLWMWPSRHSEMDLVDKAKAEFFSDGKKHFKYFDVWKIVEKSPKYTDGAEPAPSGAPKRTKVSAAGNYSSSEGGPTINLNVTDDDVSLSSSSTQSRPMGTKTVKRKVKGKATASYSAMPPPPPNHSLDKIFDSVSDKIFDSVSEMSITWWMSQLTELTSRESSISSCTMR